MFESKLINHKAFLSIFGIIAGIIVVAALVASPRSILKSFNAELNATLSPSQVVKITGRVQPWANEPIAGRNLVLCELLDETSPIYPCRVTSYTAITDGEGRFEITEVMPGRYLILYDSGLGDFAQRLRLWESKDIQVGDLEWLMDNLFRDEPDRTFIVCRGMYDFYYYHFELTLGAGGSPFMVAHDVEMAIAYKESKRTTLPPAAFRPVVVQTEQGHSSNIEFPIFSCKPHS